MVASKAVAKAVETAAKVVPAGFTKAQPVSPALKKFLGVEECSRVNALRSVWSYIKDNQLQNPERKREIMCDDKLKTIFGKDRVEFVEVSRLLNSHFRLKK